MIDCNKLTRDESGYCSEHINVSKNKERERYKVYNNHQRDSELHSFYKTKEWKVTREFVLARDNYLCQRCKDNKTFTEANFVHHIKELRDFKELALDVNNLISLCQSCHSIVHKSNKSNKYIYIKK